DWPPPICPSTACLRFAGANIMKARNAKPAMSTPRMPKRLMMKGRAPASPMPPPPELIPRRSSMLLEARWSSSRMGLLLSLWLELGARRRGGPPLRRRTRARRFRTKEIGLPTGVERAAELRVVQGRALLVETEAAARRREAIRDQFGVGSFPRAALEPF